MCLSATCEAAKFDPGSESTLLGLMLTHQKGVANLDKMPALSRSNHVNKAFDFHIVANNNALARARLNVLKGNVQELVLSESSVD